MNPCFSQERDLDWDVEQLDNEIFVQVGDEIVFVENQKLRNTAYSNVRTKVGNAALFGCVLLTGPETKTLRDRLCALQQRKTYAQIRDEISQPRPYVSSHVRQSADLHLPSSIVSVADLNATTKIVRFALASEEEGYELIHEILKPLSSVLVGYEAYSERLCARHDHQGPRQGLSSKPTDYSSAHPIFLLRQHDAHVLNPTTIPMDDDN